MVKQAAMIGVVAGLTVMGTKTWYDAKNYKPDKGAILSFPESSTEAFGQAPLTGIIFSLPFGLVIGLIIGVIFDYLNYFDLTRWPIANTIIGATLGWLIVRSSFKTCEYLFIEVTPHIPRTRISGFIDLTLLLFFILLSDLHIPGAFIGAIVGLLLTWL